MEQIIFNNFSTWYYITKDGKCYNGKTNRYLQGQVLKNGYLSYWIVLPDGTKKRLYAHRLVAQTYIDNPENKEQVNHIDGNKLNNCVDNLEWATPSENQQHSVKNGLRSYDHIYCFNKEKELVAEYITIQEASKATKLSTSIIAQEVSKEVKTLSGGFYWSKESKLGEIKNYPNTGKSKVVYQYSLDGKFINKYKSTGEAARSIGVNNGSHIGECCRGKIKSYKGFIWRYAEDIVSPFSES